MKIVLKKISISLLLALCLFGVAGPLDFAQADNALVQCGRGAVGKDAMGVALDCDFADAINMINRLIKYLIIIAMPLSAVAFAYAGWLYLSAGESADARKRANKIFASVGLGIVVLLSGWLVFKLVADTFLSESYKDSTYLN